MRFFITISKDTKFEPSTELARRDMLPIYFFLVVILLVIAVVSVCQTSRILALNLELESLKDSISKLSVSSDASTVRDYTTSIFP